LCIGRMPLLPLAAIAAIMLLLVHFDWEIYWAGGIATALAAGGFLLRRGLRG